MSGPEPPGWATGPQETKERTCEFTRSPLFSVFHTLRVARSPAPGETTVSRTCEVSVEWTAALDLPAYLAAVAEHCTPYDGDRFGDGTESTADGRFRSAPVDATVRPPADPDPALSEPYHYWNTPLGRLQTDDRYPGSVSALTVDLVEGPDALWTGESTAGAPGEHLPRGRTAYARVGLEYTARERARRSTDGDRGVVSGDGPSTGYRRVGETTVPTTDGIEPLAAATLADPLRKGTDVPAVVSAVRDRIDAVWTAFRWDGEGDPYGIPERAVEAATTPPDDP